ncbi:MAG: M48 family metallopeptidase [Nitrosomonadales bacterium]|nr:M48 family metallopeptidase [Nitrosomonadales bacterium]
MTTEQFPVRGFGAGLPPEGAPVQLRLAWEQLHIEGWPEVVTVSRSEVAVRRQGDGLLLEWQIPTGHCAMLLGPQAVTALSAWLPPIAVQRDSATRRWLWISLFLAIGLPLLLLAVFFAFRAEIVDAVVARIPVEQEIKLGEQLWQMQGAQLKLIEGTAANRFLEETGTRLAQARPTPYRYRFSLADDPSVNAFAMPAGFIVVHRGLIEKAASAEEVAGVLAHEIEHAEQRHSLRGMAQELGFTAVWVAVTGDIGGGIAGEWLKGLAGMQFSCEQEASADAGGYARLLAAKIDPRGMASFFETLSKQQGDLPGAMSLLSTHPASAERAAAIRAQLQTAPVFPPLTYDWAAIRASLEKDGAATAAD